ncbi:MAG: hypothetical protein ABII12_06650 [Planctomycetota bacterium]
MAKMLERIYDWAPVRSQNWMVSIQGRLWARRRYNKAFRRYFSALMSSQWLSGEEFCRLQTERLRGLVHEAIQNVPYYRASLRSFEGKVHRLELSDLPSFPTVDKNVMRSRLPDFLNHSRLKYGYAEGHTSGTSGAPMVWPYDWDSYRMTFALRARQYYWAGFTGKEVSVRFSGRTLLGRRKSGPPFGRYNSAEKQWLFSSYHMTPETLPRYYDEMCVLQPAYVDGYPSALFALAKWINANVTDRVLRPWAIIATAETLEDFQREEIERAFACRVYDYYSSSEGAPFITQCQAGGKHINPESGLVEFLRDDGRSCEPDEPGEVVVTSFFQRSLPLIRYRIGDRGVASPEQCPCGRQMPLIRRILGREDDVLYSSERGEVGSAGVSTALYKLHGRMKETQIRQTHLDEYLVRYVPDGADLSDEEADTLLAELRARLGSVARIEVRKVEEIEKSARGKTRLVIGLPKEQRPKIMSSD